MKTSQHVRISKLSCSCFCYQWGPLEICAAVCGQSPVDLASAANPGSLGVEHKESISLCMYELKENHVRLM